MPSIDVMCARERRSPACGRTFAATGVRQNRVMVALRFFAKLRTRAQKDKERLNEPAQAVARRRDGPHRNDQAEKRLDPRDVARSAAAGLGTRLLPAAGSRGPR